MVVLAASLLGAGCSQSTGQLAPHPLADARRGQQLLAQYQCGACHTIPDVPGAGGLVATSLQGFGRRSYIAGRLPNRADLLAKWIAEPQAMVPGTAMPSMGVSPDEARDMAAFLLESK